MEFVEIETPEDREEAFPILVELVPRLRRAEFLDSFNNDLMKPHKFFGLRVSGKLVSVAAAWVLMTGLPEKFLWFYAFVTTEPMRSRGYGKALLQEVEAYAIREGFDEIRVHAHRDQAIGFWVNAAEYKKISNIYRKKLK